MTQQKPFLNMGCGRVILPAPRPGHYGLIDEGVTDYALWHNVDRNAEPGVDEVVDIFRYPFPWADNSFDGALLAHIAEDIPHEIRTVAPSLQHPDFDRLWTRRSQLEQLQDGWYAFFAELHRVLTPGSIIHILSPYGWSDAGITDPTHTRLLTEATFTHSMQPNPDAPFAYATGGLNLAQDEAVRLGLTEAYFHLLNDPEALAGALRSRINVVHEIYVKLRVVKP